MKFKNFFSSTIAIILLLTQLGFASENLTTRPKYITDDEVFKIKEKSIQKDYKIDASTLRKPKRPTDGEYYSVSSSVDYCPQEKTYWCGPAAIQQSLSFYVDESLIDDLPSQKSIAKKAKTTSDGSWSESMVNALNYYLEDGDDLEEYTSSNIENSSDPMDKLERRIKYNLRKEECIPILLIERSELKRYDRKKGRHYITIIAYSKENNEDPELKDCDPDWRDKYGGKHWSDLEDYYEAVLEADEDTSNDVIIY